MISPQSLEVSGEARIGNPGPSHTKVRLILAQVEADSGPEPTE